MVADRARTRASVLRVYHSAGYTASAGRGHRDDGRIQPRPPRTIRATSPWRRARSSPRRKASSGPCATRAGMPVSGSDSASWTRFRIFGIVPVGRLGGDPDHTRSAFGRYVCGGHDLGARGAHARAGRLMVRRGRGHGARDHCPRSAGTGGRCHRRRKKGVPRKSRFSAGATRTPRRSTGCSLSAR